MALMDFLKRQLIDIIEWTDDSRDTLSYRFPDEDKEIKNGAQLIVRESQVVQFVYLGEFGDTFGPGKHTLTTDNIPILTNLKSWKFGFESPTSTSLRRGSSPATSGGRRTRSWSGMPTSASCACAPSARSTSGSSTRRRS